MATWGKKSRVEKMKSKSARIRWIQWIQPLGFVSLGHILCTLVGDPHTHLAACWRVSALAGHCPLTPDSTPWEYKGRASRHSGCSTPRFLFYFAPHSPFSLSLSHRTEFSLFPGCTVCCFPGSALPPPSAKCQSSHQMSAAASHPRWLCPRT